MPNTVRVGVQTTGIPKTVSEIDQVRDRFKKAAYDINKAGKEGGFAFGAAAGIAAKGVDIIGASAYKAGAAIGDFIHDSIKAASDLNETLGKSQVVFGTSAKDIEKWGGTAADSFGLSKQAAIEAAASFGNVFKGLDIGASKSATMSEKLVGLAGDLASFNNIDPTLALEKLRSGLAGESEPLRSVGVFLTEAKVKAKAMQMGLVDAHGELSEGSKILARYQLILDETKTAQGDFARTSDGLANSQRKANAEMQDMQATLGEKMLPAQLAVTKAQINLFQGLNLVTDGFQGKVNPAVLQSIKNAYGLEAATKLAHSAINDMDVETRDAAVSLGLLSQAEIDAKVGITKASLDISAAFVEQATSADNMASDLRESNTIAGSSFAKIATGADNASIHVQRSDAEMARYSSMLTRDLVADAEAISHGYFDSIVTQDNLAATNAEIAANRRILASHKATAAEKADAKNALDSLRVTQIGYLETLAAAGKSGTKEFKAGMKSLLKELATAHGAERSAILAEIRALNLLAARAAAANNAIAATLAKGGYINAAGAAAANKPPGHNADGGWVGQSGPELTWVGERGPEYIIPNDQLGGRSTGGGSGGGMGGGHITVNIPTQIIGMPTPGQIQAWARDAAPALARELQRQRLLG